MDQKTGQVRDLGIVRKGREYELGGTQSKENAKEVIRKTASLKKLHPNTLGGLLELTVKLAVWDWQPAGDVLCGGGPASDLLGPPGAQ